MFVDFHSHVLPGVDDGSKSIEESVQLLRMLARQGADTVIATPHYDPSRESVMRFVERRDESFENLKKVMDDGQPKILLGAEVAYYQGISRMEELDKLCIEGTNLLLLEMPMSKWSSYTVNEIVNMASVRGITPILAHVERSFGYQSSSVIRAIKDGDVLSQINASYLISITTKRKAIRLLSIGGAQVIGSDCHNTVSRPPRLDEAYSIIEKKLGERFVSDLADFGKSLVAMN